VSVHSAGARLRALPLLILGTAVVIGAVLVMRQPPSAAAPPRTETVTGGGLEIGFSLSPNRPGLNRVTVDVLCIGGPGLSPVRGVTLRLSRPGDASRQIVAAPTLHPDVYDGGVVELRGRGDVEVGVSVSRAGLPVTSAALTWTVGGDMPSPGPARPLEALLGPLAAALLIGAGTAFGLRRRRRRPRLGQAASRERG
jgi:hypothetical protein